MRWPRIGVVIAAYGKQDTLLLAIESALRQTYPDFRIIVVVDGNPSQASELAARYRDDDRVGVHDLARNTGEQSGPNNIGVALSDAELIAFLNHDDLWLADHLQVLAEALLARRGDLAFSQCVGVSPDHASLEHAEDCAFYLMSRLPRGRYLPRYSWVGVSAWLVRKEAFDGLGGFRRALDCVVEPSQDFLYRAVAAGLHLTYADEITLIAIHSGIRRGSYRSDFDTTEHRLLAARLFERTPAAMRALIVPRIGPDRPAVRRDRIAWWTRYPRLVYALRRPWRRRGGVINGLRTVRGLTPLPPPAADHAAFARRYRARLLPRLGRGEQTEWTRDALQPLFGEGWHPAESWGRWAAERRATLYFSVVAEAGDEIEISMSCFLPPGSFQYLRVGTVGSRKERRWLRLKPDAMSDALILLRHRVSAPEEEVCITFDTAFGFAPVRRGGADLRSLRVGVNRVSAAFAPHSAARLAAPEAGPTP